MPLTDLEIETICYIANGMTYQEIACKCGVSTRTVYARMSNIKKKLCARSTCHAVAMAVMIGVVMMY